MKYPRMASLVVLVLAGGLTMAAQTTPSGPTTAGPTRPNAGNGTMSRGRQQPCWEQAGVSQTVAHQRRQILLNTESQIGSVCSNQSLTPQERQQQIRQLREQERQQTEGLITPQQQQAINTCRQQRGIGSGGEREHQSPCREAESARQTPPRNTAEPGTSQPQSQPERDVSDEE